MGTAKARGRNPLTDARHVRYAIAPFDQVEGVTDTERDEAWKRIQGGPTLRGRGLRVGLARGLCGRQSPQTLTRSPT